MKNIKIFKDNVHGYIQIPKDIVDLFIDTPSFQRLRQIEQTGMRILYPSARHDRFSHSLGTYFLACKASKNLIRNIKAIYEDSENTDFYYFTEDKETAEKYWEKYGLLFTIASLLHDCAHSPFSHTLEFLYEYPQAEFLPLRDKVKELLNSEDYSREHSTCGTSHELMSSLIVINDYSQAIKELLTRRKISYEESDIEFVVRAIIGCQYHDSDIPSQIKNCFIDLLNSSYIDVDSLDYIIRDSLQSGIDNVSIDVDRLLGALTIVEVEKFKEKELKLVDVNADIKGVIQDAKISAKCNGSLELLNCSGTLEDNLDISGVFKVCNEVRFIPQKGNKDYTIRIGSMPYERTGHIVANDEPGCSTIRATTATDEKIQIKGDKVSFGNNHNAYVDITAENVDISIAHISGKISGLFTGEIIGNSSSLGGTITYKLGFHKSALSVMNNVIIARNYEYRWIYSHHKVVYSANYLLIDLLKECLKYLEGEYETIWAKMFGWISFIEGAYQLPNSNLLFYRPTDSDILFLFNQVRNKVISSTDSPIELKLLLKEFFSRKYRISLWKSYSEFCMFFNFLTSYQKEQLKKMIQKNSHCHVKVKGEVYQYGKFNGDWEIELEKLGFFATVWVNASSKMKSIKVAETYIHFENKKAITYKYATDYEDSQIVHQLDFFYLYYRSKEGYEPNLDGLKNFLFQEIKKLETT